MAVRGIRRFAFLPIENPVAAVQTHTLLVRFARPTSIKAVIYLNVLSCGVELDSSSVGVAAAGVRTYGYIDPSGAPQTTSFVGQDVQGSVSVDQCEWIEFGFSVRLAFAAAHGVIYVLEPVGSIITDIGTLRRLALFYRQDSGQVVGSAGYTSDEATESDVGGWWARQADDRVAGRLDELRADLGAEIGLLDDERTVRLSSLAHRVDLGTGELVPLLAGRRLSP